MLSPNPSSTLSGLSCMRRRPNIWQYQSFERARSETEIAMWLTVFASQTELL